jgi:hypothetical protein
MRPLVAGVAYFAMVFGAGFVLGPIRILWLAPRVGARIAELIEMPVMLAVIVLAARFLVRRMNVAPAVSSRIGMGLVGLVLLLTAEFTLVLRLRGMSIADYFAARDPVSGTVYTLSLAVLALMPLFAGRR